jgi:hypothetical protein
MAQYAAGRLPASNGKTRTSVMIVAVLAGAFGIGLVVGLVAPRVVQGAPVTDTADLAGDAATDAGAAASGVTDVRRLAELQAAQIGGGGLDIGTTPVRDPRPGELRAAQMGGSRIADDRSSLSEWPVAAATGADRPAIIVTDVRRLAELQAAQIGGGGLDIRSDARSGR